MKEYIPDAPLQKYIHRFWIVRSPAAMPAEKCVLDGFVGGHQTGGDLFIKTPDDLKLLFCLFKIPIHLLNNDVVPLEVFLGPRTREFKERVLEAPTDEAKIGVFTGQPPVAFYSKPHPIEAVYVGRASKNLR